MDDQINIAYSLGIFADLRKREVLTLQIQQDGNWNVSTINSSPFSLRATNFMSEYSCEWGSDTSMLSH